MQSSAVATFPDPSALTGLSGPALAGLSFAAVLLVGAGLLARRGPAVGRAVDLTVDGSPVAVVYGLMAFALVGFLGGYLLSQVARVAPGSPLTTAGGVAVLAGLVTLAGFGYLVVGAALTELEGTRREWPGAVVGAVVSALPWLLVPTTLALAVWVAVAAVGLGSPTRRWVHGARTVESEARDRT